MWRRGRREEERGQGGEERKGDSEIIMQPGFF